MFKLEGLVIKVFINLKSMTQNYLIIEIQTKSLKTLNNILTLKLNSLFL